MPQQPGQKIDAELYLFDRKIVGLHTGIGRT